MKIAIEQKNRRSRLWNRAGNAAVLWGENEEIAFWNVPVRREHGRRAGSALQYGRPGRQGGAGPAATASWHPGCWGC